MYQSVLFWISPVRGLSPPSRRYATDPGDLGTQKGGLGLERPFDKQIDGERSEPENFPPFRVKLGQKSPFRPLDPSQTTILSSQSFQKAPFYLVNPSKKPQRPKFASKGLTALKILQRPKFRPKGLIVAPVDRQTCASESSQV